MGSLRRASLSLLLLLLLPSCLWNYLMIPFKPISYVFDSMRNYAQKCDYVIDVHYYPNDFYSKEFFAASLDCPFTMNPCTQYCVTNYIAEHRYEDYVKEWAQYGMIFPYPRPHYREVFYPNNY